MHALLFTMHIQLMKLYRCVRFFLCSSVSLVLLLFGFVQLVIAVSSFAHFASNEVKYVHRREESVCNAIPFFQCFSFWFRCSSFLFRNSSLRFFGIIYIFRRGLLSTLRIFFSLFNFCYQFYCMCTTKSAVHFYSFTSTTQRSIRNIK